MPKVQMRSVCPAAPTYHERRFERRRKIFLMAKAWGVESMLEIGCTIRDVSRTGCKLESQKIDRLDEDIFLAIRGFNETIRGRIVWREGNFAGVMFLRDSTVNNPV